MKYGRLISLIFFVVAVGCSSGTTRYPHSYFTFEGLVLGVSAEPYENVFGMERAVRVKVIRVTKGKYGYENVSFGFPANHEPPLKIGKRYVITAAWGRHGMLLIANHEFPEQSQHSEETKK